MATTTDTLETQDTTTQTTPSQQTGTQPTAGAGGGQVQGQAGVGQSPTGTASRSSSAMSRREPGGLSLGSLGNPFALMRSFADEMDRLFESFGFGGPGRSMSPGAGALSRGTGSGLAQGLWSPQIEVSRRGNELVVCADLPGMRREDLNVEVCEDHLVLQGERRQEHENEEGGYYRSERSYGRFYRTIPLPEGTDPEKAQATFKDGVLEIKMPLPEQPQERSRRIEVR
jgi:HSP20 family protein